jgi:Trypsin-like serine proteases, typically periplasmic, contain C-terminal PDZ domain
MSQMNPDPYQPFVPSAESAPAPESYWVPPPPPPPTPPRRGEPHLWRWIALSVIVAVIAAGGSGIGVGLGLSKALGTRTATVQSPIAIASPITPSNGSNGSLDAHGIAATVDPAIVDINTIVGSGQAAGTGMILTSDGEVLTNNHVVKGSTTINVTIAGRSSTFTAHVVGVAPAADVALIQIEGVSGLPTVTIASSANVKVGDPIVALGNALGAGGSPSVSSGSVIALNQTITASEGGGQSEQLDGMIQSDAPISPGDSGGPIVNSAGQVIGMITAGDVQGFRSQTSAVNYAIPSDTALTFVNRIRAGETSAAITYGQVGFMGVSVRDLTAAIASQLGLSISSGALVVQVQSGSPADSAGITPDSVITKVGDAKITTSDSLGTAIKAHKPGDSVSVTWVDQRGTHTSTLTLAGVNP